MNIRERAARAQALLLEHMDEVMSLTDQLPLRATLPDGRELRSIEKRLNSRAYRSKDGMVVIAAYDATPHGILLHISASYRQRDPSWHDLKQLRATFFAPDKDVIQVLPRAGQYVNVHTHCFHLFEAPSEWQGGLTV